jgi:hypothetical protein
LSLTRHSLLQSAERVFKTKKVHKTEGALQRFDAKDKRSDDVEREGKGLKRRDLLLASSSFLAASTLSMTGLSAATQAQQSLDGRKPNILVIFGDDIGVPQISAYTMGMMGYRAPNIDRIATEGALFTDAYGQQSCTAGRASFILGQEPFRTGLLTIGMPGDPHGVPQLAVKALATARASPSANTPAFGVPTLAPSPTA